MWNYGPLPVYALALLDQMLSVNVESAALFASLFAILACGLTYWVSRFLLSWRWALICTLSVFLGGWGGFLAYLLTFNGAIALGAVSGLLCVASLLSYLKSRSVPWIIIAGISSGGALLSQIDFGFACVGTVILCLVWIARFPANFADRYRNGINPLLIYVGTVLAVVGIGYGIMSFGSGWQYVWAGLSTYNAYIDLLWAYPQSGMIPSWGYTASGLGGYLLAALIFASILFPETIRKYALRLSVLVLFGLGLMVLPGGIAFFSSLHLQTIVNSSKTILIQEAVRVIWAPAALLLTFLLGNLIVHWFTTGYHKKTIGQTEWSYVILVVYSTLIATRFFSDFSGASFPQYASSVMPILVFSVMVLIPRSVVQTRQLGVCLRVRVFMLVILLVYGMIGFISEMRMLADLTRPLTTPRGTIFISTRNALWAKTLQYIAAETDPGESILVLGFDPAFYFLSKRENLLRQDIVFPTITAPGESDEIVKRIQIGAPRIIVVAQWIEETNTTWLGRRVSGRQQSENLESVLGYVRDHYRARIALQYGGCPVCRLDSAKEEPVQPQPSFRPLTLEEWGFVIYEIL
jgi:hypothetical protein